MTDDTTPDATIAEIFVASDPVARFVVAMGMAKNDVERALRDVLAAGEEDRPDLSYRVRLGLGHLAPIGHLAAAAPGLGAAELSG